MPPVGTRPETDVTLEWHEGFSRMSPDRGYSATHRCTLGQPISGHRVRARWQAVSKCYLSFSFFFFFFFVCFSTGKLSCLCRILTYDVITLLADSSIGRLPEELTVCGPIGLSRCERRICICFSIPWYSSS